MSLNKTVVVMKKHINKRHIFSIDLIGSIWFSYDYFRNLTMKKIYTFINRLRAKARGIEIGNDCRFWGNMIWSRFPGSTIKIGNNCAFVSNMSVNYRGVNHCCVIQTGTENARIEIGSNCGFSGCSIVSDISVKIGDNVTIGTNVMIGDRDDHKEIYDSVPKKVVICDNVWIGMNSIILKGVHIGENVIIGAGSIVTKDIPANCIAAGVPCKFIKKR